MTALGSSETYRALLAMGLAFLYPSLPVALVGICDSREASVVFTVPFWNWRFVHTAQRSIYPATLLRVASRRLWMGGVCSRLQSALFRTFSVIARGSVVDFKCPSTNVGPPVTSAKVTSLELLEMEATRVSRSRIFPSKRPVYPVTHVPLVLA